MLNVKLLHSIGKIADHWATMIPKTDDRKHLHMAIAYKKNKPVEIAFNEYNKSSAMQRRYAKAVGKPNCVYDHAEIALINKCYDKTFDILVVLRIGKTGHLLPSKPCEICRAAIADTSIKKLIYSGKNTLIEERIK
jgi:tRNA(Arg) A34 adenosine deaminase TadA